jgi:hypothetical protein
MIFQINSFLDEKMNLIKVNYPKQYFEKIYHKEVLECSFSGNTTIKEEDKCIEKFRKKLTEEEKEYLSLLDIKY